jgi:hypothetical protein
MSRHGVGDLGSRYVCGLALAAVLLLASAAQGMYDPHHGRWFQRDPLGVRPDAPRGMARPGKQYRDSMSLLEYCRSKPDVYVDPLGEQMPPPGSPPWGPPGPWPPPPPGPGPNPLPPPMSLYVGLRCVCVCGLFGVGDSAWDAFNRGESAAIEKWRDIVQGKEKDVGEGNWGRAYRHCVASGILARLTQCACSACLGDSREGYQQRYQRQDPRETSQAKHNNKLGRLCAGCTGGHSQCQPPPTRLAEWVGRVTASDEEIKKCCWQAILDGKADLGGPVAH